MKEVLVLMLVLSVFYGSSTNLLSQSPTWTQIAPGVWKSVAGTPEKLDLYKTAEIKPNIEALLKIGAAEFPLPEQDIVTEIVNGQTYLRFPLVKDEQIFGFGLNFKTVYQRGRILQLHVDHYGGTDNGRTHAPVPFYVSDRGYGVFINSSRYLAVYAGSGVRKESPEAPEERDRTRFPDPPSFVEKMREMGIRLNLWTNPYVSSFSPIYNKILPYTGSHTVWGGAVPDLTITEAQDILSEQLLNNQINIGISGYKIDECDGYDQWLWPDVAKFPSGNSAEQIRQTYGLLLQKMTTDLYRQKNTRTYGLVRASNGGGSSFPYVIYNDYYSHEDFITALINSGYCGVLWTPDNKGKLTGTISKAEKGKPDNIRKVTWRFMSQD